MVDNNIKKLREVRVWTQAELARKMGISRAAVNAWEMGISAPSTQYLIELASLFKVSTDYILGISYEHVIDTGGLTKEDVECVYAMVEHLRKKNKDSKNN